MAYVKIFPIKATADKAVKYILNPEKTDEQLLVSSFGCTPETAAFEFSLTRKEADENVSCRDGNLAWHLIQSFKPEETDAVTAHEIGKQFADSVLKGKYEYVITTHVDKNHIHNHIVFNATSFIDYHKYRSGKNNIYHLCRLSNRICQENGLSVSVPTGEKSRSYKENMEYNSGKSWKAMLKASIDKAIWSSVTFEEFQLKMQQARYEIRHGKHLSFRAPEQKYFTNCKTLGSYYTEEKIFYRISQNRNRLKIPKNISREVRLYIDMTSYIANNNRAGFEHWAKLNNLKEAAKTFNYLSEHKLLNYEDFQNHMADMDASIQTAQENLNQIYSDLNKQRLIKKQCTTYRSLRQVIQNEKISENPEAYRCQHSTEYILHDKLKTELQSLGISKLPNPDRLERNINDLESQYSNAQKETHQLEKQRKTLDIIEQNFQQLLDNAPSYKDEKQLQNQLQRLI